MRARCVWPGSLAGAALLLSSAGGAASDLSSWRYRWERPAARPPARKLDGFGVGNGRVFALAGTRFPLNTLHNILGPRFGDPKGFFGDQALVLAEQGRVLDTVSEEIGHLRRAPVVETTSLARLFFPRHSRKVELRTIDFAPPGEPVILRRVKVRNPGPRALEGLELQGYHWGALVAGRGWLEQRRGKAAMSVRIGAPFDVVTMPAHEVREPALGETFRQQILLARGPRHEVTRWSVKIPRLGAGEEWNLEVTLVFALGEGPEEALARIKARSPDEWLETTREYWKEWSAAGAQVELPDAKTADLFDEVQLAIRLQQEPEGGVSPLSRYRKSWLRDTVGPLRYALAMGRPSEALAMADYLYKASLLLGRISNSYPNSLDVAAEPPGDPGESWWRERPFMPKRKPVEAPSYLVLQLDRYWRWTGDLEPLAKRYGFLKHAVLGQLAARSQDGILPMSGDETWRTNMVLQSPRSLVDFLLHQDENRLSVESHFLLASAAQVMERLARALGRWDDEAEFRRVAVETRESADREFWGRKQFYYTPYAIEDRNGKRKRAPGPLAHVQYMALWSGFLDPRVPAQASLARLNLLSTIGRLGQDTGNVPNTRALFGSRRLEVFTGMEPGLLLWNLAELDHPLAEEAFDFLRSSATPSGNYFEFYRRADLSSVRLIDDPYGSIGNSTSLYRPWEGGINLEAAYRYLFGLEPDLREGRVEIRPQLPKGWNRVALRKARLGTGTLGMELIRSPGKLALRLDPRGIDVKAALKLTLPGDTVVRAMRLDGKPVRPEIGIPWDSVKTVGPADDVRLTDRPVTLEVDSADP